MEGSNKIEQGDLVALNARFLGSFDSYDLGDYQSLALDLYRAITCYRMCSDPKRFLELNPELSFCSQDIFELWEEFDQLSQEELANIAIRLLSDL
jgi:hypothetical protein